MSPIFIYLLQVNIALALFYLLYAVLLKRNTFFKLRRFFFLSAILFSLLYPFIAVPSLGNLFASSFMREGIGAEVLVDGYGMAEIFVGDEATATTIPWTKMFLLIYATVTTVFILRFFIQFFSIFRMKMRHSREIISGVPIYQLDKNTTPFSFFRWIFIHSDQHSEEELSQILLHEQIHVRQWHSIDIMLIEMMCPISWWNPFVWLMRREVAMNLEYLADNAVLCKGVDSHKYQCHLLQLTYHETAAPIVNNFNVSQLKQRIMMMNKTKSPTSTVMRYLFIVPLLFLFLTANSIYAVQNAPEPPQVKQNGELQESAMSIATPTDLLAPDNTMRVDTTDRGVFEVVEKIPEFPGGIKGLNQFLSDNIKYPVIAKENGKQGRVIVRFIVKKDGSIGNVDILREVDPDLDNEAVRVVKSMPKWTPGMHRGEAVNVYFTMPVIFKL